MRTHLGSRALLLPILTLVFGACGTPVPSQAPSTPPSIAPSPVATTAGTPTAEAATPSPVVIVPRGVEVFQAIERGHWEIAASGSNLGPVSEVKVVRAMTEFVEVNSACSGNGTLHIRIDAAAPAIGSKSPAPTVLLVETTIDCPETSGAIFSLAGTAPAGWFPNPDSIPSDPSIRYEVLVGTIVD